MDAPVSVSGFMLKDHLDHKVMNAEGGGFPFFAARPLAQQGHERQGRDASRPSLCFSIYIQKTAN
jgi:hypothetical protein